MVIMGSMVKVIPGSMIVRAPASKWWGTDGGPWNCSPIPWPTKALTTPYPWPAASVSMARPMSEMGRPGRTASMATSRHSRVTPTRRREASSTLPTPKVALVSPWTPSRYTVTSMLTMSPSARGRSSGIPWQMTSLTDVHTDLGYPR